jgi:hypothetical protein
MPARLDDAESSVVAGEQSGSTTRRRTTLARRATFSSEGAPVERGSPLDHRATVVSLART